MFVKHVGSSHPAQTTLYWPSKNTVSVEVQPKQLAVYSVAVRQTEALTIRRAKIRNPDSHSHDRKRLPLPGGAGGVYTMPLNQAMNPSGDDALRQVGRVAGWQQEPQRIRLPSVGVCSSPQPTRATPFNDEDIAFYKLMFFNGTGRVI